MTWVTPRWRWWALAGLGVLSLAGMAALTLALGLLLRPEPVPVSVPVLPPPPPQTVTYEVSGAGSAQVAATDENDRPTDRGRHRLPWRTTVMTEGVPWVAVAAVDDGSVRAQNLTCRIWVDDRLVAAQAGKGNVTCRAG